jgi:hypothetical protein
VKPLLELRLVGQLVEAAPVPLTGPSHVAHR